MDIPRVFGQFFDLPQETGNPDQRSQILRTCDPQIGSYTLGSLYRPPSLFSDGWKNCSDRILSDPELSVLAKGSNFALTPAKLPIVDIVTTTEVACRNLSEGDASELRAKVVNLVSRPKLK